MHEFLIHQETESSQSGKRTQGKKSADRAR